MKRSIKFTSVLLILTSFFVYLVSSCKKEQNTKHLTALNQEIPEGFPQPLSIFADNPLSSEGFELGRKLFYDGRLSIDNMHSCASCHQQMAGFGTFDHDRSHGVNNSHTLRNAPVLFNLAWSKSFDWDSAYSSLESEASNKIHADNTMDETFEGIINKLNQDDFYRNEFKKVFRYPLIKPEFILKALSQFTGFLVSANSKYDRVKKGQAVFSTQEDRGYQLFKQKCISCHVEPLFTDYSYRNIGLPLDNTLKDFGKMRVTNNKQDSLKFKVPTLRNVSVSANYMHDGRFNTLFQVLEHYRTGVQTSATMDPLIGTGISLTTVQQDDLLAFLKTLTDSAFIGDSRFKNPF